MNPHQCFLCLLLTVLMFSPVDVFAKGKTLLTFTNPIAPRGQDPWVVEHGNRFYYCYAHGNGIAVRVTDRLEEIGNGKETVVWQAPPDTMHSKEIWAPELHHIGNRWYIYFAADDGNNHNHRMYVLRSEGDDPLGPYTFVGKVTDAHDRWAIDGTVLQHKDGKLYFIWSGWPGNKNVVQNLYIAPMRDPVSIAGEGVVISTPTHNWERIGDPKVNEGPQVLQHGDKVHIIYSASGSWTDDYCLGRLTLVGDDPMDPASWVKHAQPVFKKTDQVFGPGHASFVHLDQAKGANDWIVYHAARHSGAGWNRDVRLQPFMWDEEGNPQFGKPVAPGVAIEAP